MRHYDQPVLRLALHLTGTEQDAQDVYQDAFLKAYKNIGSFRFECSFYTWIYRIVTNFAWITCARKTCARKMRRWRRTQRWRVRPARPGAGRTGGGESGARFDAAAVGRTISGALEKLTPRERMVFELRHYHGLKLRTVGEILHTTEETAKNTLFRATQKLRGQLADMR